MRIDQVAAQLYTCRALLKTPSEIATTLGRLSTIGYKAVQLSGLGPMAEEELIRILNDKSLTCCGTHEPGADILLRPEKVAGRLDALGCKITAYPFPEGVDLADSRAVGAWIQSLQRAGEVLARAGKILCYHNHNHEFRQLGGKLILDMIYDGTTREALQGELDTYWIQYGGGDTVKWCARLDRRLPIIHLKDYQTTQENKPHWCEIGAGVLDFKAIIAAAEAAGCGWFVVEQDTCPGDPIESLEKSFRYIEEHLIS